MPGEIRFAIGQVLVEVLDDVECAVHPPPVPWIRADVGIDSRLLRRGEAQLLRIARLQKPAGDDDLLRCGDVMPFHVFSLSLKSTS